MDIFLDKACEKVTQHAMSYAIRSGIGISASYAIRQTARLLKTVDNRADYDELQDLQRRLNNKIKIISPAIDMVELISARGNTTLESAVSLTKALRWDIQNLGKRLAQVANNEEVGGHGKPKAKPRAAQEAELKAVTRDIKRLLNRIEDAVPLINLAITTSGARLTTSLPATISPSRLLQASTFLTAGDTQYSIAPGPKVQIGPTFVLTLYMLFAGAVRSVHDEEAARQTTWKEVIHKARVKLIRVPFQIADVATTSVAPEISNVADKLRSSRLLSNRGSASEFAYQIDIVEDLNDDRAHSFDDDEVKPGPYDDIALAGIRELVPIHQISKIFYADTGKILDLGSQSESNNPILLLKRDVNAPRPGQAMHESDQDDVHDENYVEGNTSPPRSSHEDEEDHESALEAQIFQDAMANAHHPPASLPAYDNIRGMGLWSFPPDLDPEWLALEVYTENYDDLSSDSMGSDNGSQDATTEDAPALHDAKDDALGEGEERFMQDLANLNMHNTSPMTGPETPQTDTVPLYGSIRSSLSLLEMLIRLTSLQQFQQASHLSIPDELLTFFLEESSTTGAGGEGDQRRRARQEARHKVGFDPYDESPIKRRGEDYLWQHQQDNQHGWSPAGTPPVEDRYRTPSSNAWRSPGSAGSAGSAASPSNRTRKTGSVPPPSSPSLPYSHRSPGNMHVHSSTISRHGPSKLNPSTQAHPTIPTTTGKSNRGTALGDIDSTLGTSPGSPAMARSSTNV